MASWLGRVNDTFWSTLGFDTNNAIPGHTAVAVPLYIYPDPGCWDPLHKAIAEHPSLSFHIIINPFNGPGGKSPDEFYKAEVARLNAASNTTLFGYVHVLWGKRELAEVYDDISSWASWGKCDDADVHVDGIFFDEAPTETEMVQYMRRVAQHAKRTFSQETPVWTNPGLPVDEAFYEEAELINAVENSHEEWISGAATVSVPKKLRAASTAIVHSCLTDSTRLAGDVRKLRNAGYRSVVITTASDYTSFGPLWQDFVAAMDPPS